MSSAKKQQKKCTCFEFVTWENFKHHNDSKWREPWIWYTKNNEASNREQNVWSPHYKNQNQSKVKESAKESRIRIGSNKMNQRGKEKAKCLIITLKESEWISHQRKWKRRNIRIGSTKMNQTLRRKNMSSSHCKKPESISRRIKCKWCKIRIEYIKINQASKGERNAWSSHCKNQNQWAVEESVKDVRFELDLPKWIRLQRQRKMLDHHIVRIGINQPSMKLQKT